MTQTPTWFFYLGLLLAIGGTFGDYRSSTQQIAHGAFEANKLNRDKFGYFSPVKFGLWHGLLLSALAIPYFISGEAFFGLGLLIVGGLGIYRTLANLKVHRQSRENQIAALRRIALVAVYNYDEIGTLLGEQTIIIKGGRGRILSFGWFYLEGLNDGDVNERFRVYEAVLPQIWSLSQKAEADWFSDTKLKRVNL